MNRGDVALVLGLAGFILGGVGVFLAAGAKSSADLASGLRTNDNEYFVSLGARVDKIDTGLKELTQRVNSLDVNPKPMLERLSNLEESFAAIVQQRSSEGPSMANAATATGAKAELTKDQFDALRKKVFSGEANEDERQKFWESMKTRPELLKGLIADLEKKVGESPRDIEAHQSLASAYITRLYAAGLGPEAGMWAGKAEQQWKAILEIDPNHWETHFSLGTSYSYYPDQLNKRPDAIREFEAARKVQEASTPEAKHARTYLQLRQLYLKEGKADDAKAMLEEGLRRFPDDEDLKKLRDGAK